MDAITPGLGDIWMKTRGCKKNGCDAVNGTKRYIVISPMSFGYSVTEGYLEPNRRYKKRAGSHKKVGVNEEHFSVYTFHTYRSTNIEDDMWEMARNIETQDTYFYSKSITLAKRHGKSGPST